MSRQHFASNVRVETLSKFDNSVERLKRWLSCRGANRISKIQVNTREWTRYIELLFYQILMSPRRHRTWSSKQVGNY